MLQRRVAEERCREVLEKSGVEKCCREVLEKSVGETCCGELLGKNSFAAGKEPVLVCVCVNS